MLFPHIFKYMFYEGVTVKRSNQLLCRERPAISKTNWYAIAFPFWQIVEPSLCPKSRNGHTSEVVCFVLMMMSGIEAIYILSLFSYIQVSFWYHLGIIFFESSIIHLIYYHSIIISFTYGFYSETSSHDLESFWWEHASTDGYPCF